MKRALLIGINQYQIPGIDLRGCVNDVDDMAAALVEFCGFKHTDIKTLIDGAATKDAVQSGIKALGRDTKNGDVSVLHYSGYGSSMPGEDDQGFKRSKILCTADLNWDEPLHYDSFRTTLDKLPAGASFIFIKDCCHSATNTRAILPPDARQLQRHLPSPWGSVLEPRRSLVRPIGRSSRSSQATRKTKDIVNTEQPEILIAACRDTQTAQDALINGRYSGALTFAIVEAIRKSKGRLTCLDLHARTSAILRERKFEQVPQLKGRTSCLDRLLFP